MYVRIIPFSQSFDNYGLSYSMKKGISIFPGQIINIPLKTTTTLGLIVEIFDTLHADKIFGDIKEVGELQSDFVFLSPQQIQIICYFSSYYICGIHHMLGLYFPKNLREKIENKKVSKIAPKNYEYILQKEVSLNIAQKNIVDGILLGKQKKHLIYGITGSGKTQIYMKIIEENLKLGKQTLLLIPEIILTSQIASRVIEVFGKGVIVLHSGISAAKKSQYWMDIYSSNAKIIIGTRSSLFFPYNNLGAIIIDEEHDQSYISDSTPRYHAGEVAEKLSELYDIPLILGSGTPKVTTFYRGVKGDFKIHYMLEKYQ